MAVNDVKIVDGGGGVRRFRTDDRNSSGFGAALNAGEPLRRGGAGNNFAIVMPNGGPEFSTDLWLGISVAASTETATADGRVDVQAVIPGVTRLRARATTAANVDTDAELLLFLLLCVGFDYSSQTFTIDENETDQPTRLGLQILDGDISTQTLVVEVRSMYTKSM